jgi:glycosyltransferase involved in cell wall biosynthesis
MGTYNQERYVDDALASISRQTTREFELIIIDDASTDGTVERIRRWLPTAPVETRLIVNEHNRGACASRNHAITQARGEFLCGFSGDDVCEPHRIEVLLSALRRAEPEVALVYGDAWLIDTEGARVGRWFETTPLPVGRPAFDALLERCFVCLPAAMMRRSAFDAVGGYDERHFIDDQSLLLRLADRFQFQYVDALVTNYRMNPEGMTRNEAYRARGGESHVRVLLEWHGRDPVHDAVIEPAVWRTARHVFVRDPVTGRRLLREVCRAAPTARRRLALAVAEVPGSHRVITAMLHARDAWRARRVVGCAA